MSDKTNLAENSAAAKSPEPEARTTRRASRRIEDLDFETPDEESIQLLEEGWRRFCHSIGLEGEIPDIRETLTAKQTDQPPRWRQSRWLVRPFIAVYDWLTAHP